MRHSPNQLKCYSYTRIASTTVLVTDSMNTDASTCTFLPYRPAFVSYRLGTPASCESGLNTLCILLDMFVIQDPKPLTHNTVHYRTHHQPITTGIAHLFPYTLSLESISLLSPLFFPPLPTCLLLVASLQPSLVTPHWAT